MTIEDILNQDRQTALQCFEKIKVCIADTDLSEAIKAIIKKLKKDASPELINEYRGEFGYLRKSKNKQGAEDCGYTELLENSRAFKQAFEGRLLQKIRDKFAIALEQFITTCLHRFAESTDLEYEFIKSYGCPGVIEAVKHLIQRPQDDNASISAAYGVDIARVKEIEGVLYAGDQNGKTDELIVLSRIKFWQRYNTAQNKKLSLLEIQRQVLFEHNFYIKNDPKFGLVGTMAFEPNSVKKVIKELYLCMKTLSTDSPGCHKYIEPYAREAMSVDHKLIQSHVVNLQRTYLEADPHKMSYLVLGELPDFSIDRIAQVVSGETTVWHCEESLCLA